MSQSDNMEIRNGLKRDIFEIRHMCTWMKGTLKPPYMSVCM